ncbi:MAG: lamin tail domain-containing protein [Candidatus Spechtbacterales bacterium]
MVFVIFLLLAIAGFYLVLKDAEAEGAPVVINEVAWMGGSGTGGHYDEWIELYNNTNTSVDLSGWILKANDDTPAIELSGSIQAGGYFLLARNSETSLVLSSADLIYGTRGTSWALKNDPDAEHLKLLDGENTLIDEVNSLGGWFAGDNSSKQTMERVDPGTSGNISINWNTSNDVGGTPKAPNSSSAPEPEPEPEAQPEPAPESEQEPEEESNAETTEQQFEKTNAVIISEFIPNPEGNDSEEEWIELYNSGSKTVDISGWFLDNKEGGIQAFQFPNGTNIMPQEYRVFSVKLTGLRLTNTGDSARILYPDNTVAHETSYVDNAKEGQSYALIGESWQWTDNPTPGTQNMAISEKEKNTKATKTKTDSPASPQNSATGSADESEPKGVNTNEFAASINQGGNNTGIFVIFLLVVFISLIGTSGIWFLKKKYIK